MAARLVLAAAPHACGLSVWLRRCVLALKALRSRHRSPADMLGGLSAGALKDIGLSRSDLPAVRAGLFAADATRRKR